MRDIKIYQGFYLDLIPTTGDMFQPRFTKQIDVLVFRHWKTGFGIQHPYDSTDDNKKLMFIIKDIV